MNVTLVNKSKWSDEALKAIVDFLAPCFNHVDMPVRLTIESKKGHCGTWGKAYFPDTGRRAVKKGEWSCVVRIGTLPRSICGQGEYPITRYYPGRVGKRAGGYVANSIVDEVVHTIAHELRHIEQFEACRLYRLKRNAEKAIWAQDRASFGDYFRRWERNGAAHFLFNSCEVDAELISHGLLAAYKTFVENNLRARAIAAHSDMLKARAA
jgi:hypothetical protein